MPPVSPGDCWVPLARAYLDEEQLAAFLSLVRQERPSASPVPAVVTITGGDPKNSKDKPKMYSISPRLFPFEGRAPRRACGVPQFQLPQRTPGQTRQARDGRRGPPGGAWAGPGAHCGVGPAWVLGLFVAQTPIRGARWSAERHSLSRPSQFAKAPYCAPLSAQPRPAAGRATPWPGPPCDRPPLSASLGREEVSRLA